MLGSKKSGDYCWSAFSGQVYHPLGLGTDEPVEECVSSEKSTPQKAGGGPPPPKPQ
jgi:hypothetical protein